MTIQIHDVILTFPPLLLVRSAVAAVWLYEGFWCKLLRRAPLQAQVVECVPRLGPTIGQSFLTLLGVVEVLLAVWVMTGFAPGTCAITQAAMLVALNANGLLWARHIIPEPAGMVVKNIAFLVLVWSCGALPGIQR